MVRFAGATGDHVKESPLARTCRERQRRDSNRDRLRDCGTDDVATSARCALARAD
jgi:hypothetical protein